jgi:hypothetical protein
MSDAEFALIRPLLLSPKRRVRKPTDTVFGVGQQDPAIGTND